MEEQEINLELDNIQSNVEERLKVKNRFEKLSEKVILTSKEKDEAIAKATAAEEARQKAEKDLNFYKGFSTNVSKYPQASAYQDKIKERVDKGYDTEDAILAVLAKEGKLTPPPAPKPTEQQIEGGSAPTLTEGQKSISDMKPEEKLEALKEAEKSGLLVGALRGR
jgi:hypothetical protein